MMRRLLVLLVVLGAGVSLAQTPTTTHAACATDQNFYPLAAWITDGTPTGGPTPDSIECEHESVTYQIFASTVIEALIESDTPWSDGWLDRMGGTCGTGLSGVDLVYCTEEVGPFTDTWMYFFYYTQGSTPRCSYSAFGSGATAPVSGGACSGYGATVNDAIVSVERFDHAFDTADPAFMHDPFMGEWEAVLATGRYTDCAEWDACVGDEDGGGGEEPGGSGDPDGPDDPETNCGILDIPCNFRKLFLPQVDWAEEFAVVSSWGGARFPFGIRVWFEQEDCAGFYFGCGGGVYYLEVPVVGSVEYGGSSVDIGGWTLLASHEDGIAQVVEPLRPVSTWWISEPLGGRKLLFYTFVTGFFIAVFRRLSG